MSAGSDLGQKAKQFMDAGKLVPDDLIISMVKARISEPDAKSAWILDGFPVNTAASGSSRLEPVASFCTVACDLLCCARRGSLRGASLVVGRVRSVVPSGISRITRRRPLVSVISAAVGSSSARMIFLRRSPSVSRRTRTLTAPLLTYYREKDLLREIDANRSPSVVFQE